MFRAAQIPDFSSEVFVSDWGRTLDRIISEAELAEQNLATQAGGKDELGRKDSGSFYTPADVAYHVWDQFFRLHAVQNAGDLRELIARFRFVEPSAGAGIFLLTFIKKAMALGLDATDISKIGFSIIDINLAALRFVNRKLIEFESCLGISLSGVQLVQRDFLEWANDTAFDRVAFVGNPPFVSNERGSRWRNLFADFVEAMLAYRCREKSIGLILPMSVCFSRDYEQLRKSIFSSGLGVSAASYDNIPDCLFKAGKPESQNSNKANSQRCTVLMLGGPDSSRREASELLRWSSKDRKRVLTTLPLFHNFEGYEFDGQIPRPESSGVLCYLSNCRSGRELGDLICKGISAEFSVGAVARNFIGIREARADDTSAIAVSARSPLDSMVLLQAIASPAFYKYWRTVGDGFHVTRDILLRFPLSDEVYETCVSRSENARSTWQRRQDFAREKLNSGRIVRSFDFGSAFDHVAIS